jgi:GR25 family glycosyltransferase involved in LPS biosynthesis
MRLYLIAGYILLLILVVGLVVWACRPIDHYVWQPPSSVKQFPSEECTFVINLPDERGRSRREHLFAQARRVGWTFTLVDAVDKETIDYPNLLKVSSALRSLDKDTQLTRGEIALSQGHRNIYKTIIDRGIDVALVCEDDIELCEEFVAATADVCTRLLREYPDFDVAKLEYQYLTGHTRNPGDPLLIRETTGGACTACYLVSYKGAIHLSDVNTPIWANADGLMDNERLTRMGFRPLEAYHVSPPLARQVFFQNGSHRDR